MVNRSVVVALALAGATAVDAQQQPQPAAQQQAQPAAQQQAQPAAQQQAQPAASPTPSLAQQWGLMVYPSKNQPKDVQDKDEYECYQWAKQQTGIDPLAPQQAQAAVQPAQVPPGGAVRGAAGGAAAGAAIGAIAGDAGKGAAIGATAGAMKGAANRRKQQAAANQQAAAATQQQTQKVKDTFNKAFSVCLDGRGYSVK